MRLFNFFLPVGVPNKSNVQRNADQILINFDSISEKRFPIIRPILIIKRIKIIVFGITRMQSKTLLFQESKMWL